MLDLRLAPVAMPAARLHHGFTPLFGDTLQRADLTRLADDRREVALLHHHLRLVVAGERRLAVVLRRAGVTALHRRLVVRRLARVPHLGA